MGSMVRVGMGLSLPVWLGLWGLGAGVGPSSAQSLPKPMLPGETAIVEALEAPALVGLPAVVVQSGVGPVPLGAIVAPQMAQPNVAQPNMGPINVGPINVGQSIGPALGLAQTPSVMVPDLPPLYGLPGSMDPQPAPISQPAPILQSAPIAPIEPISQPAPIAPIEPVPLMEVNQTPAVMVLDFGQPLPGVQPAAVPTALVQPALGQPALGQPVLVQPTAVQATTVQQAAPGVAQAPIVVPTSGGLLPKGTMLPLRYMGSQALQLKAGAPQPEVLILDAPIVDPSGRVILPSGTQVVGRFETDRQGSRFVVQAVAQANQSQLILAASGPIGQKPSSKLALGSGIGAAAGLILGGKAGLLGGAAVGAATSYFTPPKSVTIAPNQVVMVRLEDDWR